MCFLATLTTQSQRNFRFHIFNFSRNTKIKPKDKFSTISIFSSSPRLQRKVNKISSSGRSSCSSSAFLDVDEMPSHIRKSSSGNSLCQVATQCTPQLGHSRSRPESADKVKPRKSQSLEYFTVSRGQLTIFKFHFNQNVDF